MKVKFVKTHPLAKMPVKKHSSDFCYDVYAATKEQVSENVYRYGLGIAMQIDRDEEVALGSVKMNLKDFYGQLSLDFRPRSSVWETGFVLSNCEGTIDEGYIGEIKAVFYKVAEGTPYEVGDRIGQIKVGFTLPIEFTEVDNLLETERGSKCETCTRFSNGMCHLEDLHPCAYVRRNSKDIPLFKKILNFIRYGK